MPAWLPWIAAAAILVVLPVLLRLYAGEEPDNAIRQEQGGLPVDDEAPDSSSEDQDPRHGSRPDRQQAEIRLAA
jgi:hypothetical protein